jgi:1-phosphofructokinase
VIITVTLNPALDKTAELDILRPGELNRLKNIVVDAGGKGINVSKMVAALGGRTVATGFAGGSGGEEIIRALSIEDIATDFVKVDGLTRTNLKVLDQATRLTELNEPGVMVTEREAESLIKKLAGYANADAIFALSGSLCQGVEIEFYARLIRMIHNGGGIAFLDADGEAFRAALEEKPDFIKPNRYELMDYYQVSGNMELKELAELCVRLRSGGVGKIAASMGAEGALFAGGDEIIYAPGIPVRAHSAVGAGDSMTGAFAYGLERNLSWRETCALALASSAGAAATAGTKPPDRRLVEELREKVQLHSVKI